MPPIRDHLSPDAPPKKKHWLRKVWDNGGKHVAITAGVVAGGYALGKGWESYNHWKANKPVQMLSMADAGTNLSGFRPSMRADMAKPSHDMLAIKEYLESNPRNKPSSGSLDFIKRKNPLQIKEGPSELNPWDRLITDGRERKTWDVGTQAGASPWDIGLNQELRKRLPAMDDVGHGRGVGTQTDLSAFRYNINSQARQMSGPTLLNQMNESVHSGWSVPRSDGFSKPRPPKVTDSWQAKGATRDFLRSRRLM